MNSVLSDAVHCSMLYCNVLSASVVNVKLNDALDYSTSRCA